MHLGYYPKDYNENENIRNFNYPDIFSGFITIRVADSSGVVILNANNLIQFTIKGNGIIVATDNGDPTDFVPFPSHKRKAFNGLSLAIIRSKSEATGAITLTAKSLGLKEAQVVITSKTVECIFYFDHIEKKY